MSIHSNHSQQNAEQLSVLSEGQGFYAIPELTQRLDLIRHLINNSDLMPLMRGEVGAGKSTAISQLQAQANENWLLCRLDATPTLHPDQLMGRLARFFGISEAESDIHDRLIRCFESIRDEGRVAVIIIDDADQLPPASLIALLRLHEQYLDNVSVVALVLFALPAIDRTLAMPQLRVMNLQQFHVLDMPLLSREQVPGYLQLLLEHEGLTDQLLLAEQKMDTLFSMSEGLPGKLTPLILRSINESVSISRAQKKRFSFRSVIVMLSVGVIVACGLLFQDEINQLFNPVNENLPQLSLPKDALPEQYLKSDQALVELIEAPRAQDLNESISETDVADVADVVESEIEIESIVEEDVSAPSSDVISTPVLPEGGEFLVEGADQLALEESLSQVSPKEMEPPVDIAPIVEEVNEESAPLADDSPDVDLAQEEPSGVSWVKRQSPTHFTLQLIGVSEVKSIDQFIQMHDLKGELFHIKLLRKGLPWYILLLGSYPDVASTKAAISHDLPRSLQKKGVWVRSFESLQRELD